MPNSAHDARPRSAIRTRSTHFDRSVTGKANVFSPRMKKIVFLAAPPASAPTLEFAALPFRQGQPTNFTCSAASAKPAPILVLYKNEEKLFTNRTKIVFHLAEPDSSWDEAIVRCEQFFPFVNVSRQSVSMRIRTLCECAFTRRRAMRCSSIDLDKPKVRIESQNRNALTVNSTATFRCVANGNPEAKFR